MIALISDCSESSKSYSANRHLANGASIIKCDGLLDRVEHFHDSDIDMPKFKMA